MTLSIRDAVHHGLHGGSHVVQFYDDEQYLYGLVADFIRQGLRAGEPAVIIATPEHADHFRRRLESAGVDVGQAIRTHELTFADARESIATFMDGDMPHDERFRSVLGGLFETVYENRNPKRVRAYGEMVDLLWRDGNPEAAVRLEELWNDLAGLYLFDLLCAYPMGNFYKETDAELFADVMRAHGRVMPTEKYADVASNDAKAREISALQQRAEALSSEVAHRKELEKSLLDALSARRTAEDALRRNERELTDFVENAPVGMHWVGADGRILWVNECELRLLGYEPAEYLGHHIADFHVDAPVIEDILRRLTAGEEIVDREARVRAKDGSIKYVSITSNALRENGEFVHSRCFTRDITDRKRLEEERAFMLDLTTVLHSSLDYETRLRELAHLAVPRLGDWCAVDIVRDGASERVHEAGTALHDASEISVPMSIGERTLGTITLRSSQRQYEHHDRTLAAEVAKRAAMAIENARLYQLAQHANRTKDEFLATLSHELRTPLTAILGWARLLTIGGLDPETTRVAFETIERSARTQATLIDDLLDLSRVVTGKLTLQSELVDLVSVVDNAVQTLRLAAEGKNIRFEFETSPDRMVVTGDPTRLQQITWNLLSNAIKFSNSGGSVHVSLRRDGDSARIVVRDNGRGISPQFLPHVFEAFRQADGATTRAHGGLGLGLAIVKYLAELHGGTVAASSEGEGKGATFTVLLPLALRRAVAAAPETSEEIVNLAGTTVLLVDDDADTRDLITAILRRCGAEVEVAESVRCACEILDSRSPHVVITDISMPEQDGYELLDYVRGRNATSPALPIIALTALGHPEVEERMREAGFHAYVRKPVDPLRFARVVAGVR